MISALYNIERIFCDEWGKFDQYSPIPIGYRDFDNFVIYIDHVFELLLCAKEQGYIK